MTQQFDRGIRLGIVLVAAVSISNAVLSLQHVHSLFRSSAEVTHTQATVEALTELLSSTTEAETGQRGYVITGDDHYLEPYWRARGQITARMRRLDSLTRGNVNQQSQLPVMRHLIQDKFEELRSTIALRQNEGFAAAERVVSEGAGQQTMDSLGGEIRQLIDEERHTLDQRTVNSVKSRDAAITAAVISGALELATLAALVLLIRRYLRARNEAEASLAQQKEWFRTTLGSIGDGVIAADITGRITWINGEALRLTGWTESEALGRDVDAVFRIVNEHTRAPVTNPMQQALRDRVIAGLPDSTMLIARDGREWPVDDTAAPIHAGDGSVIGAVLVFRDVTQKRVSELRLLDADRRKDEFLAVLAHELRNPLAPLRNALEILRMSGNDSRSVEQVGGIMERQLQQMVRLIDDLLDISRVTRNKLELRREPIDVASAVHSALETCGPLLRASGHMLNLTLPPHTLYVDADRTRLAQAFSNLISNAIKYTPAGGRIWLSVERDASDAVITVRDSGVGLPVDMLEQIFEMFVQVDRSLERSQGGLGIGLPLVRRIIEMHSGSVTAASDGEGKGSRFAVRLPLVLTPPPPAAPPGSPAAPGRRRRILIADDNRDAARSLAMVLGMMGHIVTVAHDGEEAVTEGERFQPDVALLDIGMPKMNGYDVAKILRQTPWGRNIVIIALTGWGQDDDRRRSQEAGFDHHMVKPVEIPALEGVLNK